MSKRVVLFFLVLTVLGCKNFETKKVSSQELLEEELKAIDMQEVDEYPSFNQCDSLTQASQRYSCFKEVLSVNFYNHLQKKVLVVNEELHDTVWVKFAISQEGTPKLDNLEIPKTLQNNIPQLGQWLRQSLDSLPVIHPAIKRGIPVKTAFKMPIVISTK